MSAEVLCVGLRFRPRFSAGDWQRALRAIVDWEPALAPTHVSRRDDPAASPREPWSDELWPELARRLAERPSWSWALEHLDSEETSFEVGRGLHQADVLIALDRPPGDLVRRLVSLVETLRGAAEPALAFAYDCRGPDAELALQGLQRLADVPPLLYLDAAALERVGDVRGSRCRVLEVDGGLVLDVRDPFRAPTELDRQRTAAAARLLGLPVSFL